MRDVMTDRWRWKLYFAATLALLAPGASVLIATALLGLVRGNASSLLGRAGLMGVGFLLLIGAPFARTVLRHMRAARGLRGWARRNTRRMFMEKYFEAAFVWVFAGAFLFLQFTGYFQSLRPPRRVLETYWFAFGVLAGIVVVTLAVRAAYCALFTSAIKRDLLRLGSHVYCEQCGYVLDGQTGSRCPECGHELCRTPFAAPFGREVFLR